MFSALLLFLSTLLSLGVNGAQFGQTRYVDEGSRSRPIIVSTVLVNPFLMLKENAGELKGNAKYHGYVKDLIEALASKLNYNYTLREVRDGKFGRSKPDGTWDGMIGVVMRGEADMALAPITVTSKREKVVDFSKPFMTSGISMMIKRPKPRRFDLFFFLNPFSFGVWLVIIFAYVIASLLIFVLSILSPNEHKPQDPNRQISLLNSFWFMLSAFLLQGPHYFPRSVSVRVVNAVWWLFTLFVMVLYIASLAPFLFMEMSVLPIESPEDLLKQSEVKFGTVASGSTYRFFKESNVHLYQLLWQRMFVEDAFVSTYAEGIERVRKSGGRYAFFLESTANDYVNSQPPCDTIKIGSKLNTFAYAIATPFGSPLKNDINLAILELQEVGDLKVLTNRWWQGKCWEEPEKSVVAGPITLSQFSGLVFLLIAGLLLALLVGVLERVIKIFNDRRTHQMDISSSTIVVRSHHKDAGNEVALD